MTNEEAIERLQSDQQYFTAGTFEAVNIAIAAIREVKRLKAKVSQLRGELGEAYDDWYGDGQDSG